MEVLPLSTGCLGACTYCKTKHARGELGSYALSELVSRFRDSVQARSAILLPVLLVLAAVEIDVHWWP